MTIKQGDTVRLSAVFCHSVGLYDANIANLTGMILLISEKPGRPPVAHVRWADGEEGHTLVKNLHLVNTPEFAT